MNGLNATVERRGLGSLETVGKLDDFITKRCRLGPPYIGRDLYRSVPGPCPRLHFDST